jgi:hypothetical protein
VTVPSPLRAFLAAGLLVVLAGCGARPPAAIAQGQRVECPGRSAVTVTRLLPYGGGYPALNVRRVDGSELAAVDFDGSTLQSQAGAVKYRYRRWRNARGQGYRLEALISTPNGTLFADGAVWDPAQSMDRRFFHEAFWPMINSLRAAPQPDR